MNSVAVLWRAVLWWGNSKLKGWRKVFLSPLAVVSFWKLQNQVLKEKKKRKNNVIWAKPRCCLVLQQVGELRAQNYFLRFVAPDKWMVVWLLLFLAWTLGLEIIPSSVTNFPCNHFSVSESTWKKHIRDLSSSSLTLPPLEHVRNQFKGLDNSWELVIEKYN